MDLTKFKDAFEKMDYDGKKKSSKPQWTALRSTVIVTDSSDLDSAADSISSSAIIKEILVQESVSKKFLGMLKDKIKSTSSYPEVEELLAKGFEVIGSRIVKCPLSLVPNEKSTIIALDVFRTSMEAISLANAAQSVNLWCNNLSITFEYINSLSNAYQIFLNSTNGTFHSKIPFFIDGRTVCDDEKFDGITTPLIEVSGNVQFQTTFQGEKQKFRTVVIPFGETFAN